MSVAPSLSRRLFKLEPGEGRKVLLFALLGGLIQAGIMVGLTASDTLFLSRVGFERLPYLYMATPVLMVVYVPVFTWLVGRIGTPRTLELTLGVLTLAGIALFFMVPDTPGGETYVYYGARLYAELWYIALYTLFWNFTDTFFDIQDAKRLFALFSAGSAAGAMVGGGLVAVVSQLAGIQTLFLVWSALALATVPVARLIGSHYEVLEEADEVASSKVSHFGEIWEVLKKSRFVLVLVSVLFVVVFLSAINEYEYLRILSADIEEAELASLLGRLLFIVNVFNLLINLFLFNRLVLAVGVGNVALIQPLTYLATFFFLLFQGGYAAAIFGFVAMGSILPAIELNNQNFLFNAVPPGVRSQIRTAAEGLAEPLAGGAAGLLLILVTTYTPGLRVSVVGFVLAGGYLTLALLLRSTYLPSLVQNLKRGWLDLSQPAEVALAGLASSEKQRLRDMAAKGEGDLAQCALRILAINDPEAGYEATLDYLENAPEGELAKAGPFVEALLRSADPQPIRRFLDWIGSRAGRLRAGFLEEMGGHGLLLPSEVSELVDSPEPGKVASAIMVLWKSWDPNDRLRASQALVRMLGGSEVEVSTGLRTIGRLGDEALARYAASYLGHDSPVIRQEALAALRHIATPDSTPLVPDILRAIEGADDRSRFIALDVLARIADPVCIPDLLGMATDFSPPVRRNVLRTFQRIGLRSVPASVSVLEDPRYPYAGRAIATRFLGAAAPPQLEALSPKLIRNELQRAYLFGEYERTLAQMPDPPSGIRVLRRFYRDTQDRIVDFVLEVLHVSGRLPAFEMLSASLRSEKPKERANALETVEQGVSRPIFKLLLPLLTAGRDDEVTQATPTVRPSSSVDEILRSALKSPFTLEAAAAADAIWITEDAETRAMLRSGLKDGRGDLYRQTVVILASEGQEGVTPVDLIDFLRAAPFFKDLRIWDLEQLSDGSSVVHFDDGEQVFQSGEDAERVFVVAEGACTVDGQEVGPGTLLGGEGLGISGRYRTNARSEGMTAIAVPAARVQDVADASPTLGIELIRYAAGEYGVAAL